MLLRSAHFHGNVVLKPQAALSFKVLEPDIFGGDERPGLLLAAWRAGVPGWRACDAACWARPWRGGEPLRRAGMDASGWCHTRGVGDHQRLAPAVPRGWGPGGTETRVSEGHPVPAPEHASRGGVRGFLGGRRCCGPAAWLGRWSVRVRRPRRAELRLLFCSGILLSGCSCQVPPPCPPQLHAVKLFIKTACRFSHTSLQGTSLWYGYSFAFSVWKILSSSSFSLSPLPCGCGTVTLGNPGFGRL